MRAPSVCSTQSVQVRHQVGEGAGRHLLLLHSMLTALTLFNAIGSTTSPMKRLGTQVGESGLDRVPWRG